MSIILAIFDFILHIDVHLDKLAADYGLMTYAFLWLIIFCETGLVVTPFLPGDSLLFAAGALASRGTLSVWTLGITIFTAAVLGDAVNYAVGAYLGPQVFQRESRWIKRAYLVRTQAFFEKYGGKAIVFARFVPIVRTFAPFLAGVGTMQYRRFAIYNVVGALLWTVLFVGAGFFFGEIPVVKKNFTLVIMGIIVVSVLPAVFEAVRAKMEAKRAHVS